MKTKTLSPAKLNRIIEKRNQQFKAASQAEKRVLIAKDILSQIKIGSFKPSSGFFFKSDKINKMAEQFFWDEQVGNESVQKLVLSGEIKDCRCCALGSIALSCTLFKNQVNISEVYNEFDPSDAIDFVEERESSKLKLLEIFSQIQLKLIEVAFERGRGYYDLYSLGRENEDSFHAAKEFGKKYRNHTRRLVAIMKNIIKNKGEFKP